MMPVWRVQAWVTAPGDFPSQALKTITVHAPGVCMAIDTAKHSAAFIMSPVVVSVERIDPPRWKS
jgi:hypothetical protein